MPIVRITMFEGRSREQKKELARVITEAVVNIGKTTPDATEVIFEEVSKENWAFAGVLADEK